MTPATVRNGPTLYDEKHPQLCSAVLDGAGKLWLDTGSGYVAVATRHPAQANVHDDSIDGVWGELEVTLDTAEMFVATGDYSETGWRHFLVWPAGTETDAKGDPTRKQTGVMDDRAPDLNERGKPVDNLGPARAAEAVCRLHHPTVEALCDHCRNPWPCPTVELVWRVAGRRLP